MGSMKPRTAVSPSPPAAGVAVPSRAPRWSWSVVPSSSVVPSGVPPQMSRKRTSLALVWMKWRRSSTSSPISTEQTSSASAACSTLIWSSDRLRGVDGGVPQLAEVHLAQALQALEVLLVVGVLGQEGVLGRVVLQVDLLLADQGGVQRRLGHVDVAALHQRLHLAEEERQQEGPDVAAVDVGVGQHDDLVVADLGDVEVLGQAGADGGDQRLDLGVLQHLVDAGPLDVQDLAPDGQDGLGPRVAGVLGRAAGRVPLDDEQLALPRGRATSSRPACPGRPAPSSPDLRRVRSRACWAATRARWASSDFLTIWLASVGFSSSHSASFSLVARSTSERMGTLPSLALVWPSNCGSFSRTDTMAVRPSRMSLPSRFSSFSFSRLRGPGVAVDHVGQGLLEALLVHAALGGRDPVGEGEDALVEPGVPLEGDLDLLARPRPARRRRPCGRATPSTR